MDLWKESTVVTVGTPVVVGEDIGEAVVEAGRLGTAFTVLQSFGRDPVLAFGAFHSIGSSLGDFSPL